MINAARSLEATAKLTCQLPLFALDRQAELSCSPQVAEGLIPDLQIPAWTRDLTAEADGDPQRHHGRPGSAGKLSTLHSAICSLPATCRCHAVPCASELYLAQVNTGLFTNPLSD